MAGIGVQPWSKLCSPDLSYYHLVHNIVLQRRKLQGELELLGAMEGAQGLQQVYRRLYARRIVDGDEYTADIWRRGWYISLTSFLLEISVSNSVFLW